MNNNTNDLKLQKICMVLYLAAGVCYSIVAFIDITSGEAIIKWVLDIALTCCFLALAWITSARIRKINEEK